MLCDFALAGLSATNEFASASDWPASFRAVVRAPSASIGDFNACAESSSAFVLSDATDP
ncbi:hypothetical protein SJ05684_b55270 (plasmid) [Sinorhizobium sojae CCBAU 05684]|uniref:Uncharacterized protein n=1 Tax=Sinorhizobium sojae CCBAU 05684 TaxID=716928 RepID=A0A249PMI1_9HYPH|nr:hypothetical protein SJ05684_b55270 [Sinorhizobium sojae CCBAU 05684]